MCLTASHSARSVCTYRTGTRRQIGLHLTDGHKTQLSCRTGHGTVYCARGGVLCAVHTACGASALAARVPGWAHRLHARVPSSRGREVCPCMECPKRLIADFGNKFCTSSLSQSIVQRVRAQNHLKSKHWTATCVTVSLSVQHTTAASRMMTVVEEWPMLMSWVRSSYSLTLQIQQHIASVLYESLQVCCLLLGHQCVRLPVKSARQIDV